MNTWRMRIPKSIILLEDTATDWFIEGLGAAPVATVIAPPPPPPPPPEALDDTPFSFPPQPPYQPSDDPTSRLMYFGTDPFTGRGFLAGLPEVPNPDPTHYLYAGMLPGGVRLWADALARPGAIRFILSTGKKWPG